MTQLDQLLQKYEFENSQLSKALSTERDKITFVNIQKKDVEKQIHELEAKTTNLMEEIRKEKVYDIDKNREIERLKKEAYLLRDHRNTMRTKIDRQNEKYGNMLTDIKNMIRDGTEKLESYLGKYENIPGAQKKLQNMEKIGDLKNKIGQADDLIVELKEKENEAKSLTDKTHFQVYKLNKLIQTSLLESADNRKNAKFKYSKSLENIKIREKAKLADRTASEIGTSKQVQLPKNQKESISNKCCEQSAGNIPTDEMSSSATSTPKPIPRFIPSIQLSQLISLSNVRTIPPDKSDVRVPQLETISTPKRVIQGFSIPQIKTPNLLSPPITPLIHKQILKRNKPQTLNIDTQMQVDTILQPTNRNTFHTPLQPSVTESDTYSDTRSVDQISGNAISLEASGQNQLCNFRFGFMEDPKSPKSANPFAMELDGNTQRGDSGFDTGMFSKTGSNTSQEAENHPFSFSF
ncbi:hypothetical protein LOD99_11605 [Oopsacas minuta]|uniref:Uncharacterized protein n=1 Tax=Oopsacas minuta TaxID=111878 RepID=A0AAV7JKL5_9METZ|nr:hypothetical protein LOD99_11605 [Oopsacas minuta]